MQDSLIGQELEHYLIEAPLGQGGMGVVYRGTDMALRRPVAIKVLAPNLLEDQKARRRFQKEIEAAVAIEHPHVVPIHGAGFDKGHFFLVMRLVGGHDVKAELDAIGRFDPERALRLIGQVASALHAVHRKGMVHRDIKPHNVLLGCPGESDEHAQLTDFGIAKALDDSTILTGVGPIGTPMYMAPEICEGRSASPASDQYSLAVMAYEMLCGVTPFDGSVDYRASQVSEDPPPLRSHAPEVGEALADAIHRALAKNPADRFDDVRDLVKVDPASRVSFDHATAVSHSVLSAPSTEDLVHTLADDHGLSDAAIAALTDGTIDEVARTRRRVARAALLGTATRTRGRRGDRSKL